MYILDMTKIKSNTTVSLRNGNIRTILSVKIVHDISYNKVFHRIKFVNNDLDLNQFPEPEIS
jgi:hypothetical protein